ncbi:MAG: hypothetical protein H9Q66_06575, partial [Spiroplasma ixodetis]|nr:hypothetical protein [Spiroplasma ixodetis]
MPLIGRQFVRITEFNKLEQRVKRIEDNSGIQIQADIAADATRISRSNPADDSDSDKEEEEKEKKLINLYIEPDFFTDNINSFNKNSIPKYPDLSYAGHKTFIFIRIHLHNQVITKPKKHNTATTSEFGEYNLIFEYVFSYFTFFIYTLGKKNFSIKENEKKYMFYNTDNVNETICFDYRPNECQFTESNANITFIINHKKVSSYDHEKFINLIN